MGWGGSMRSEPNTLHVRGSTQYSLLNPEKPLPLYTDSLETQKEYKMRVALCSSVTSLLFSLPRAKDQAKRPLAIFSFT